MNGIDPHLHLRHVLECIERERQCRLSKRVIGFLLKFRQGSNGLVLLQ